MPVRENPDHAWEVHMGSNFFEALAKLKHAWNLWKAGSYLITIERFKEEAGKLLGGTFHKIKPHIRTIKLCPPGVGYTRRSNCASKNKPIEHTYPPPPKRTIPHTPPRTIPSSVWGKIIECCFRLISNDYC